MLIFCLTGYLHCKRVQPASPRLRVLELALRATIDSAIEVRGMDPLPARWRTVSGRNSSAIAAPDG